MTPTLIYCAKRNHFASIAAAFGFHYGAQLPNSVADLPLYFADQRYKKPNRRRYMTALAQHRPALATVLDIESPSQLSEALDWADEASEWVSEAIILIPKCEIIDRLPASIRGRQVRLGYAVPTSHGSTPLPAREFADRPVHLLGGNPLLQYRLAQPHFDDAHVFVNLDVWSLDQSYIQKSAIRWGQFLEASPPRQNSMFGARPALRWRQLNEVGLGNIPNAPYEAFRRSCSVLKEMWASLGERKPLNQLVDGSSPPGVT